MPPTLDSNRVEAGQAFSTADTQKYGMVPMPLSSRTKVVLRITAAMYCLAWISQLEILNSRVLGRNLDDLPPLIRYAGIAAFFWTAFAILLIGKDIETLVAHLPPFAHRKLVNTPIHVVVGCGAVLGWFALYDTTRRIAGLHLIVLLPAIICWNPDFRRWLRTEILPPRQDEKRSIETLLEHEDFHCMSGM
ncbi:MAG: hypothetical protein LQ339_005685 [Xanthoria mediterranea]|nr:MAG: hypothetical protein LQ339_005685 [Xanthoria mediterranea]